MKCNFCKKETNEVYTITISGEKIFTVLDSCYTCANKVINLTKRKPNQGIGTAIQSGIGNAVSDRR